MYSRRESWNKIAQRQTDTIRLHEKILYRIKKIIFLLLKNNLLKEEETLNRK